MKNFVELRVYRYYIARESPVFFLSTRNILTYLEALIINISTRQAPVTKEARTRKMILHAQFFKRSKSIQIILAPRNFETRCENVDRGNEGGG